MAIDYQREEELEAARLAGSKVAAPKPTKKHLQLKQALDAKDAFDFVEDERKGPVAEVAKKGISGEAKNTLTAGMTGGSPLTGLLVLADAMEEGLEAPADLDDRMERFPELRDVHLDTGAAVRFPELAEDHAKAAGAAEMEEEEQER
jgi:hypothetical protein